MLHLPQTCATTPVFCFWRGWEQDEGMETPETGPQGLERGLQKYLKS